MADTLKQTINISTTSTSTEFELVPNGVDSTKTIVSIIMCNTTANDCSFDMMMNGTMMKASGGKAIDSTIRIPRTMNEPILFSSGPPR